MLPFENVANTSDTHIVKGHSMHLVPFPFILFCYQVLHLVQSISHLIVVN